MVTFVINAVKFALTVLEAIWFYLRGIAKKLWEDDILFLASGLAFNGMLALIPLLMLAASAIGIFLESSERGLLQLIDLLKTLFPAQPYATTIQDSIIGMVSEMVTYRRSLGLIGFIVLIYTATSLFDGLRSVLHTIYNLKKTRGMVASFVHHVGFVFLIFVLFVISTLVGWLIDLLEQLVPASIFLVYVKPLQFDSLFSNFVVIVLTGIMFYITYRHIPDIKPPRAAGVISTVLTTTLWVISGKIFGYYLSHISLIGKMFGPYAYILVLLVWIYYCAILFILGAIVGQVYWEREVLRRTDKLERWV